MNVLRQRLRRAQADFLQTVEGVDPNHVVVGAWSIRDVVAHLVDWNAEILLAAEHLLGRAEKPAHHPIVDHDRFNATSTARHAADDWAGLKAELAHTVDCGIELAAELEGRLEEPVDHPWNNHGTIRDLFHGVCGHQEEHTAEIRSAR